MTKPVLRGVLVVAFFALCAFYLIPVYVPRPAFIPGFAPPPDMWPRTVSLIGILLGLVVCLLMLSARSFRGDLRKVVWGAVAGLAITSGWAGTAWLARTGFGAQTLMSHSYAAPVGLSLIHI